MHQSCKHDRRIYFRPHIFSEIDLLSSIFTLDCHSKVNKGKCTEFGTECWCSHEKNTAGHLVCGYPKGYNGRYYSIAKDSVATPWTIIKGVGLIPHPKHCKSDDLIGCSTNCATNKCTTTGCYGTDLSCWDDTKRWDRSSNEGIVRCINLEGR